MPPELTWRARILDPANGRVYGAGVLVDQHHVVTCAHVIGDALGLADMLDRPDEVVQVDFPQSGDDAPYAARVIARGWFPERQMAGDLAIIEVLDAPLTVPASAPLLLAGESERRLVRVFGHPPGHDMGVWARARLMGRGGPRGEWIQMDGLSQTGKRIQRGFSGAGVWDEDYQAVIGCVVVGDREESDRVAWMIPNEVITGYWSELDVIIRRQPRKIESRKGGGRPVPEVLVSDRRHFAATLLGLRGMRERASRDLFVQKLGRIFDGRLRIDRQKGDLDDTLSIVDACLEHPGALHELAELLRGFHDTEAERHLVEEVASAADVADPSPLLRSPERNRLYRLLTALEEHITPDMVQRCYREATGP